MHQLVLCIFDNQYIIGKVLSWSVILRSNFLQYLMVALINFSWEFCFCEYVDAESLFVFRETSVNSLEMQHFPHKNKKLFDALSMVTITNFQRSSTRCLLTSGSLVLIVYILFCVWVLLFFLLAWLIISLSM